MKRNYEELMKDLEEKRKEEAKEASNSANVIKEILESDDNVYSVVADEKFFYTWILNSGYLFHMCPHKEYFNTYKTCNASTVRIGYDCVSKVVGICTVKVKLYDDVVRILIHVKHILKLRRCLNSFGDIKHFGCNIFANNDTMNIVGVYTCSL